MSTERQHHRVTRRTASPKLSRPIAWLRASPVRGQRELREDVRQSSPLKIDRDKCVIYGVKVLGRISKNTHDAEVECTEYSTIAMQKALPLYENSDVYTDHPSDRKSPGQSRSVYEAFGKLRNCRIEKDGIRADLHYKKSHDMAEAVIDDIELRHGNFGLSHNARAGRETIRNGRLVIEEIVLVRSVDLVTKPATNRNLWESHRMATTTLRKLLTKKARTTKGKENAIVWDLLEDDAMPMDDPVDDVGSPDDALRDAFIQSGSAVLAAIFNGEIDMAAGIAKIKDMAKAHGNLLAKGEPDGDEVEEEDDEEDKPTPKDKEEADGSDGDDEDSKDKKESYRSKAEKAGRELAAMKLCVKHKVEPSDELLEAITGMSEEKAVRLVERFKATGATEKPKPRSIPSGRNVSESQKSTAPKTADWLNRLR